MKSLATLLVLAALAGCYRTRFELTPPMPEIPSAAYDNHFHFSLINIIEISSPVDLQRACSGGPVVAIYEDTGIVGGIVNALFSYVLPILHVKNATVLCGYNPGALMGPPRQ